MSEPAPANLPAVETRAKLSARDLKVGTNSVAFANAGEMMAFSRLMADSGMAVPKEFRGNAGACLAVISDAVTFGMQPFQLARQAYFVNGTLAYMAQAIAAVIIARAPIKGRPKYNWQGSDDDLVCTVTVVDAETGEIVEHQSPRKGEIKPQNSPLWKSDPRQQIGYYTIRAMARLHYPEVLMGIYDLDEAATFRREVEGERRSTVADRLPGPQAGQGGPVIDAGHIDRETGAKPASDAPSQPAGAFTGTDEGGELVNGHEGEPGAVGDAEPTEEGARGMTGPSGTPGPAGIDQSTLEVAMEGAGITEADKRDLIQRLFDDLDKADNRAEVQAAYALYADEIDAAPEHVQKFCASLYQTEVSLYPDPKPAGKARKKL